MALTEGDKAECKEIAREIVKEVLEQHIASCPHGLALIKSKTFVIGLFVGSGVISGGSVAALLHAFAG